MYVPTQCLTSTSPVEGRLGCLHFGAMTNKAAINIYVQALSEHKTFHFPGITVQKYNCKAVW